MKIGCDIVHLKRLEGKEEALAKGVLSPKEYALFEKAFHKDEFLGGRFAAKEAFLKAKGTGIQGVNLKEIEILPLKSGEPLLFFENKTYPISISHDGEYAFAVCLIEDL